ncbi:MAG: zf-HC2 domain-containing protein [Pyrinomonadaceae bacterium]|nr:zf-HC2 domain-containing protein [Pyrinomonadaceae bacterium]
MREFCLTEEVIQQFVDGELSKEQSESVASHLAACDKCAGLLDEVEQENALLSEAFAPEMSLPVPTAMLRERLDAAIAELAPAHSSSAQTESAGSRVRDWFASLFGSFSFTPQQAFGFASLAVVLAFAAIFVVIQLRQGRGTAPTVAVNTGREQTAKPSTSPEEIKGAEPAFTPPAPASTPEGVADYRPNARRASAKKTNRAVNIIDTPDKIKPAPVETKLLPGEQGYLEAIASLTTAIEANKDDVLKPAVRADYERNLAIVDGAIATTRQQAKRNPSDRDAVEFMYTAYQNKIDLLSAVADQTRIASR